MFIKSLFNALSVFEIFCQILPTMHFWMISSVFSYSCRTILNTNFFRGGSIISYRRELTLQNGVLTLYFLMNCFRILIILSSLPTKMRQSHLLTLKSYWVNEKNFMLPFCWLAPKNDMNSLFCQEILVHAVCAPEKL